jgi:hypothetical protein
MGAGFTWRLHNFKAGLYAGERASSVLPSISPDGDIPLSTVEPVGALFPRRLHHGRRGDRLSRASQAHVTVCSFTLVITPIEKTALLPTLVLATNLPSSGLALTTA